MSRRPSFRRFLAVLLLAPLPLLAARATDGLPPPVEKVLTSRRLPDDSFSAFVQQAGTDAPVLAWNADVPRNPASTIKLLTTFAALDGLGPDFRWATDVYLDGRLEGDTLHGDLVIKGHGDPYLVTERLWLLQRELRLKGLRHIDGGLVIDHSYFAREEDDPGAFDGRPYQPYNALPDAFLVNFQAVNFIFRPDGARGRADITLDPALANLQVQNDLRLVRGGCNVPAGPRMEVAAGPPAPRVVFSGALPGSCPEVQQRASILDGPTYAYGVFKALWEEQGGTLRGGLRVAQVPAGRTPFLRFESPPLAEVIRAVNKFSNNVMTRQIYLTLGAERVGPPGTQAKSRQALDEILAGRGLHFPELQIDNGAGLSRETRISARSLGRLLLAAWDSPYRSEYQASLSVAGVDGTTRRRFRKDEDLAGQMHLKTGTLNGVTCIAGYVRAESGREYVVVAMHNQTRANWGGGQEAQNALLRWVHEQ